MVLLKTALLLQFQSITAHLSRVAEFSPDGTVESDSIGANKAPADPVPEFFEDLPPSTLLPTQSAETLDGAKKPSSLLDESEVPDIILPKLSDPTTTLTHPDQLSADADPLTAALAEKSRNGFQPASLHPDNEEKVKQYRVAIDELFEQQGIPVDPEESVVLAQLKLELEEHEREHGPLEEPVKRERRRKSKNGGSGKKVSNYRRTYYEDTEEYQQIQQKKKRKAAKRAKKSKKNRAGNAAKAGKTSRDSDSTVSASTVNTEDQSDESDVSVAGSASPFSTTGSSLDTEANEPKKKRLLRRTPADSSDHTFLDELFLLPRQSVVFLYQTLAFLDFSTVAVFMVLAVVAGGATLVRMQKQGKLEHAGDGFNANESFDFREAVHHKEELKRALDATTVATEGDLGNVTELTSTVGDEGQL